MKDAAIKLELLPRTPRGDAVKELENFFESAEADFGLSSNYPPSVNRALGGGGGGGTNGVDLRMSKLVCLKNEIGPNGNFVESRVTIQRAVRAALMRLGFPHYEVLVLRHKLAKKLREEEPELSSKFGDVAGVVTLTSEAHVRHEVALQGGWPSARGPCPKSLRAWLLATVTAGDEPIIEALQEAADAMVLAAHDAYAFERRPGKGDRGCGAFKARRPRAAPVRVSKVRGLFERSGPR